VPQAQATGGDVVEVADIAIHCERRGSGPRIVVLHHSYGAPGWVPFYERLAEQAEVLAPDLPGYGRSGQPAWARDVRDLAILVGAWLRKQDLGPVTLVGCGFGGYVAAELAAMQPQVLGRLVLVGAAGVLPEGEKILDQFLISHSEYVQAGFSSRAAYEAVFGDTIGDDLLMQWDLNREMTTRIGWKPYMYDRRLLPLLRDVTAPTLLVWGAHDRVVPRQCAERYREALPNAHLEIVPDCGHAVDLEAPDALARLVLAEIAASS
jgi:pimeloyl-ACP methyl ester carboxylesterase